MQLTAEGLISNVWTRLPVLDISYSCGCDVTQNLTFTLPSGWSANHTAPTKIRTQNVCVAVTTNQETEQGFILSGFAYNPSSYQNVIEVENISGTTASAVLSSIGTAAGVNISGASGRSVNKAALSSGDVVSLAATIANTIDAKEICCTSTLAGDSLHIGNIWNGGNTPPIISFTVDDVRPKYDSCLCTKTAVIAERKTCLVAPIQPTVEPAEEGEQRVTQEWSNINQQLKALADAYNNDTTTLVHYRGSDMQTAFDPSFSEFCDYALPPVNVSLLGTVRTISYDLRIDINSKGCPKPCDMYVGGYLPYNERFIYSEYNHPYVSLLFKVIPCGIDAVPDVTLGEWMRNGEPTQTPYINGTAEWATEIRGIRRKGESKFDASKRIITENCIFKPFSQEYRDIVNNMIQGYSPYVQINNSRFKIYLVCITWMENVYVWSEMVRTPIRDIPGVFSSAYRTVTTNSVPTIDELGAECPYWYLFGKDLQFASHNFNHLNGEWTGANNGILGGHTKVQLNPHFNAETPYDSNPSTKYNGIYKDTTQNRFYGFAEPAKMEAKWKTVTPIDQKFTADSLALENATFGSTIISQGMYGTQLLQLPGSNQVDLRPVQGSTPQKVEAICPAEQTFEWGSAGARPLAVTSGLWTSQNETPVSDLLNMANRKDGRVVYKYTCPLNYFTNWNDLFSVGFNNVPPTSMAINQRAGIVTFTCKKA